MKRREAIAELVALPEIARISAAPVKPDDVIVVECDRHMSMQVREHVKATLEGIWLGRKIVVLEGGMQIKLVAQ